MPQLCLSYYSCAPFLVTRDGEHIRQVRTRAHTYLPLKAQVQHRLCLSLFTQWEVAILHPAALPGTPALMDFCLVQHEQGIATAAAVVLACGMCVCVYVCVCACVYCHEKNLDYGKSAIP